MKATWKKKKTSKNDTRVKARLKKTRNIYLTEIRHEVKIQNHPNHYLLYFTVPSTWSLGESERGLFSLCSQNTIYILALRRRFLAPTHSKCRSLQMSSKKTFSGVWLNVKLSHHSSSFLWQTSIKFFFFLSCLCTGYTSDLC